MIAGNIRDSTGVLSAALWEGGTRWRSLGSFPGGVVRDATLTSAWSINGDASVVVGLGFVEPDGSRAFRWDRHSGVVDLGALQKTSSRGNVVSADGNVIAGWDANPRQDGSYRLWRGAVWWQGMERLLHAYGWIGEVWASNDVGSILVGIGHPMSIKHAYRFTAWDGRVEDLGALPRGRTPAEREQEDTSTALALSDDGNVVVGMSGWQPPKDAFTWTPETGIVKLSDYLAGKGVTGFENWTILDAVAVSPDGRIFAGDGINPRGLAEGWVAKLP